MTNVTLRGKSDVRKQYAWAIVLTLGLGIACSAQAMPFSVDFSKKIGTIKRL